MELDFGKTIWPEGRTSQILLYTLEEYERSFRSQQLILARYFKIPDLPRMQMTETELRFDFDLAGGALDELHHEVTLSIQNTKAYRTAIGQIVMKLDGSCSCFEPHPCVHVVAAASFMRRHLSSLDPESGDRWLLNCISDGRTIGRSIIAEIASIAGARTVTEPATLNRIQWRVGGLVKTPGLSFTRPRVKVYGYLQAGRKKGGWTKGRRIRDFFAEDVEQGFMESVDRSIATILQMTNDYTADQEMIAIRQCLWLLRDNPAVVFDDDFLTPCRITFAPVEFRMEERDDGNYLPQVLFGGNRIDVPREELLVGQLNANKFVLLVPELGQGRLWVGEIDRSMKMMLHQFERAYRKSATFDKQMAETLADAVASTTSTSLVAINLPESLAGPEQPLEPKVEMHLSPRTPEGLVIALRVACDVMAEPPIPGMEPDRLRLVTPTGRFQLTRDLIEEANNANEIAKLCDLGSFQFDGPYTWIAETEESALKLIELLQVLGPTAPTVCWPKSDRMRLIGEITPQRLQVRLNSQRDWFGIEGTANVDGIEIPLADLLAALRNRRRFVPVGNGQFAMISEQLRDRLVSIADVSQIDNGALKLSRAATAIVEDALGSDIAYESDIQWQEALARLAQARALVPKVPEELKADLRDYQRAGYEWLAKLSCWGLGGCLADDMGLGKTVQALGILLDRAPDGPALIIAPTSVGMNWARETNRFAPSLEPKLYREHDRQHLIETAGPHDLIITSYQLLQRDVERFASRTWNTMVLDEAQYIKNYQTKTAQAVREVDANWRLALSGTPLENHIGELWSLVRVLCPGLLGTWERFRKSFAEPIERDKRKDRLVALGRVVRPFILRRTKKEVLKELPERTEIVRFADLSEPERRKYEASRMAAVSELTVAGEGENEQQKRIKVLAWLTKLRQLSCHPRLVDPMWTESSAKLDLFMEIVDELREGEHRALVFSQFVQHLSLVREALDKLGVSYQYLDGSTPAAKRQDAVDAFQAGEGDLFLISLKAGGTGLNLTAADYVLHLDPWWNPAVEDQATDRAHRIGQERRVTVYRLVAKDTIEEQILALHDEKRELIAGVLDGADRAGRLSTDELVSMIRMSQLQSVQ